MSLREKLRSLCTRACSFVLTGIQTASPEQLQQIKELAQQAKDRLSDAVQQVDQAGREYLTSVQDFAAVVNRCLNAETVGALQAARVELSEATRWKEQCEATLRQAQLRLDELHQLYCTRALELHDKGLELSSKGNGWLPSAPSRDLDAALALARTELSAALATIPAEPATDSGEEAGEEVACGPGVAS